MPYPERTTTNPTHLQPHFLPILWLSCSQTWASQKDVATLHQCALIRSKQIHLPKIITYNSIIQIAHFITWQKSHCFICLYPCIFLQKLMTVNYMVLWKQWEKDQEHTSINPIHKFMYFISIAIWQRPEKMRKQSDEFRFREDFRGCGITCIQALNI